MSNVVLASGSGNALDPGDFGDPATTTAGTASSTAVTFTMTDTADTINPADGTNATRDISITMATSGVSPVALGSVTADEIEDVRFNLGSNGDTVNISGDFSATKLSGSTITVAGGVGNDTVDATESHQRAPHRVQRRRRR